MLSDKDRVRLRHMLDYAREAVEAVRGRTRADLDNGHTHRTPQHPRADGA